MFILKSRTSILDIVLIHLFVIRMKIFETQARDRYDKDVVLVRRRYKYHIDMAMFYVGTPIIKFVTCLLKFLFYAF